MLPAGSRAGSMIQKQQAMLLQLGGWGVLPLQQNLFVLEFSLSTEGLLLPLPSWWQVAAADLPDRDPPLHCHLAFFSCPSMGVSSRQRSIGMAGQVGAWHQSSEHWACV